MGRVTLNAGTLLAPLPPALVTCGTVEKPNIITIGWTGILNSNPPKTYVSVRPTRYSHGLLTEGKEFVIHLPKASMAKQVDYCGIYTGAKVNKFEICGWEPKPSQKVAAPTIDECPIAIECKVTEIVSMGTHDVFYADILCVTVDDSLLDETGRLHVEKADLCAYAHGQYYALGRVLGRFGFSTDKKKKHHKKPKDKKGSKA